MKSIKCFYVLQTLNNVFKDNPIYDDLRRYYEKNGRLGSAEQNKLTRAIIDFYVSKNFKLDSKFLKNLAAQIVALFPKESEAVYFEKEKNKRAKGKLFFRYQNMIKSSAKANISSSKKCTEKIVSFHENGIFSKFRYSNTIFINLFN